MKRNKTFIATLETGERVVINALNILSAVKGIYEKNGYSGAVIKKIVDRDLSLMDLTKPNE